MFWSEDLSTRAAVLVWLVGAVAGMPAFGQKNAPGKFVGSEACKTCHADVWSKF